MSISSFFSTCFSHCPMAISGIVIDDVLLIRYYKMVKKEKKEIRSVKIGIKYIEVRKEYTFFFSIEDFFTKTAFNVQFVSQLFIKRQ
jgi:hypothetical protein